MCDICRLHLSAYISGNYGEREKEREMLAHLQLEQLHQQEQEEAF